MKRTTLLSASDEVEQHGMIDDLKADDQIRIEFKQAEPLKGRLKQLVGLLHVLTMDNRGIRHTFDAGRENLAAIVNPDHHGGFHGYTVYQFTMVGDVSEAKEILNRLAGFDAIQRIELLDPADLAAA